MATSKDLKKRIRERQAKTGESYTTARMHVLGEQMDVLTPRVAELTTTKRCSTSSGSTNHLPSSAAETCLDHGAAFEDVGPEGSGVLQHFAEVDLSERAVLHPLLDVRRTSSSQSHQSGKATASRYSRVLAQVQPIANEPSRLREMGALGTSMETLRPRKSAKRSGGTHAKSRKA